MGVIIKTSGLTKQYKNQKAVNNVSITINKGSIYGLIGKNGAGKTTILKMFSGLARPTQGKIEYGEGRKDIKVGTLIESPGLYGGMTAYDNIQLKGICVGDKLSKPEIEKLLELVGLDNVGRKRVKNFSLGMKQRLGIALALVGNPDVLILDEPINGLDPQGIVEIRNMIKKLSKETEISVIISSHILDELIKIATDVCIIHNGEVLLETTKEKIMEMSQGVPIDEYYIKIIEEGSYARNVKI